MKYHIIFYQDLTEEGNLNLHWYYEDLEFAKKDLLQKALDHVKCDGGERQAKVALQNELTLEEIKNDTKLEKGLYLKEENGKVYVYEKYKDKQSGMIWGEYETVNIHKKGLFGITNIEIAEIQYKCNCHNNTKLKLKTIKNNAATYVTQLKEVLQTEKFGLKPIDDEEDKEKKNEVKFATIETVKKPEPIPVPEPVFIKQDNKKIEETKELELPKPVNLPEPISLDMVKKAPLPKPISVKVENNPNQKKIKSCPPSPKKNKRFPNLPALPTPDLPDLDLPELPNYTFQHGNLDMDLDSYSDFESSSDEESDDSSWDSYEE